MGRQTLYDAPSPTGALAMEKVLDLRWKLVEWLCGQREAKKCRRALSRAAGTRPGTAPLAPMSASIRLPPPFESVVGDVWFIDKHAKDSVAVEFYRSTVGAVGKLFLFLPQGSALESPEGWADFSPGAILKAAEPGEGGGGGFKPMTWDEAQERLALFWAESLDELRRWTDRQPRRP
jgi:hypothetical protein